jgi:hypothetical protein
MLARFNKTDDGKLHSGYLKLSEYYHLTDNVAYAMGNAPTIKVWEEDEELEYDCIPTWYIPYVENRIKQLPLESHKDGDIIVFKKLLSDLKEYAGSNKHFIIVT